MLRRVLFELALASDRIYMLDDETRPTTVALSPLNFGPLPMSNGLTRLDTRFLGEPQLVADLAEEREPFDPLSAMDAGLVTFAPDEIDWDDEVRLAIEARAAMSPDALTGLEANLRFAGPRDDGDEDLRPPHGVAELDLPAAQRGGRAWRAARVR